ncbi:MAG: hypothetical protein ACRDUB_11490, partial [Mycobacterium sp.]
GMNQQHTDQLDARQAHRWLTGSSLIVAPLVLRPYVDAYRVVAQQLLVSAADETWEEEQFLDACLRLAKQWSLQKRIASEESISGEMFGTGIKLATHRGLLDTGISAQELTTRRQVFAEELDRLHHAITALAGIGDTAPPEFALAQQPSQT